MRNLAKILQKNQKTKNNIDGFHLAGVEKLRLEHEQSLGK